MTGFRAVGAACLFGAVGLIVGCASARHAGPAPVTQAEQRAMTPDEARERLAEGNRRFVSGTSLRRDFGAQVAATARGQHPFAAILACIDSRSAPEIVFDQGLGDVFVARVAGNYAPADMIGSLEFATKVSGAKLVVVLGHTECGAIKGAIDNVRLGDLTVVMEAIEPAVADVQDASGDRTSKNSRFVREVTEANVRRTVAAIRAQSAVMSDLERSGQLKIVGAMYDVATGRAVFLD